MLELTATPNFPCVGCAPKSAVHRYFSSRLYAETSLGLFLRTAMRVHERAYWTISKDIEISRRRNGRSWAANICEPIATSSTQFGSIVPASVRDVVSSEARLALAESQYPLYGAYPIVAGSGRDEILEELVLFFSRSPAFRKINSADGGETNGEGVPLSLVAGICAAHGFVRHSYGQDQGLPFLTRIFAGTKAGDYRRYVLLNEIASHYGCDKVKASVSIGVNQRCAWTILYATKDAVAHRDFGAAAGYLRKIPSDHKLNNLPLIHTYRSRVDLELFRQSISRATSSAQVARLAPLLERIQAARGKIEDGHLIELLLFAATIAFVSDQVDVFHKILGADYFSTRAASLCFVERILSAASDVPYCHAYALRQAATRYRSAGLPGKAYMCLRMLNKIGAHTDADRLNTSFLALSLGRFPEALEAVKSVTRTYRDQLSEVSWPKDAHGTPWPYHPICASEVFSSALPEGASWPRISIVVPSFNQVKYVRECLLSLRAQEYPNLEVIIYDAESTDGTADIIREFAGEFTSINIEPDKGQSDAINKGMRRATGDLLHWLNTDDMLAPAACYVAALTYLETKADVIAGACVEVTNREMLLLNLPSAEVDEFTLVELCKQFDRWLKGHFFYQPEVFFSRRIWEAAGGSLDEDHHYAMDFDLWRRFAGLGARYERVCWPMAFFRKHPDQKTAQLADTLDEQAEIINSVVPQGPKGGREQDIRRSLARLRARGPGAIYAVVSKRFSKIFSEATMDDVIPMLSAVGKFHLYEKAEDVPAQSVDCILQLSHAQSDHADIQRYRGEGFKGPVVGWFWDNHHHYFANRETAEKVDLIVPGHHFCRTYLANKNAIMGDSVPLCTTQWGRSEARELFSRFGSNARSDQLFGGFVEYAMASKRNALMGDLIAAGVSDSLFLMPESNIGKYFDQTRGERFAQWCSFKTSLCLPLRNDLSQRFFDSWLTGQIPVVPEDFSDLRHYIPGGVLERHVVPFKKWTVESVMEAHDLALKKFAQLGEAGVLERHNIALTRHFLADRLYSIIGIIDGLASNRALQAS